MSLRERLAQIARVSGSAGRRVVSVYLNTRCTDEHHRDRTRTFLKNELRTARAADRAGALAADFEWIEKTARPLLSDPDDPEAPGVALFAGGEPALREAAPVSVPLDDGFFVAEWPVLAPLTALVDAGPSALVVFVDGTSARLVPVAAGGGDEVVLEHVVERRHRQGGWALLAQSRYHRHIEHHRTEHFVAVAAALERLVDERGIDTIVLAGESRAVAIFRARLGSALAARVVGAIPGTRHEPAAALADRARRCLADACRKRDADEIARVITEAAKGGRAVVGAEATLLAAQRGAVRRLYVLKQFGARGDVVDRVLTAGGEVEVVEDDARLAAAGGVAARLRYSLASDGVGHHETRRRWLCCRCVRAGRGARRGPGAVAQREASDSSRRRTARTPRLSRAARPLARRSANVDRARGFRDER